ncbi:ParA family protein [Candidatus Dojkabacteria bacterium]|uniref:ParA family protein n=1 Tax=Candidatus Dojkabacteria bacterium TaxID=2099670 RepID=A0A955L0F9_9BACT|nr:ParA family protein [Candidatus Dojkabacteria bacterium]
MVLTIINQKGGVGKTTTVINVGTYLAGLGHKVLVVDLDPQANLTSGLGVNVHGQSKSDITGKDSQSETIYDLLVNGKAAGEIIVKTNIENLDILPSGIELSGAEVEMVSIISRENVLKKALGEVRDKYDLIMIDCPPSLGLLTINALTAADKLLIPIQCEYFALEGLGQLMNTIKLIKGNLNPTLEIGGVILTMYDSRTNLSRDVAGEVRTFFADKVFGTIVPRNIRLSEAPSHGLPISEYDPSSAGAKSYKELAEEVAARFVSK